MAYIREYPPGSYSSDIKLFQLSEPSSVWFLKLFSQTNGKLKRFSPKLSPEFYKQTTNYDKRGEISNYGAIHTW